MPATGRRVGVAVCAIGVLMSVIGVAGLVLDSRSTPTQARSAGATPESSVTTTTAALETVDAFVAALTAARRHGDATFLFDRLAPAVITRYGAQQCRDYVATLTDRTAQLTVRRTSPPAPFEYTSDGRTTRLPDVVTAHVTGTSHGAPIEQDNHFATSDGRYHFFVDCGVPLTSNAI